jgi:hypothetical protein
MEMFARSRNEATNNIGSWIFLILNLAMLCVPFFLSTAERHIDLSAWMALLYMGYSWFLFPLMMVAAFAAFIKAGGLRTRGGAKWGILASLLGLLIWVGIIVCYFHGIGLGSGPHLD